MGGWWWFKDTTGLNGAGTIRVTVWPDVKCVRGGHKEVGEGIKTGHPTKPACRITLRFQNVCYDTVVV